MFRNKIDPQNVALEQRASAYQVVKEEVQNFMMQGQKQLASMENVLKREKDALGSVIEVYLPGLIDLLDANMDGASILQYCNSFFTEQRISVFREVNEKLVQNESLSKQQTSTRGSKKIGSYSAKDLRGIDWLRGEAAYWDALNFCFAALAILLTISAILAP